MVRNENTNYNKLAKEYDRNGDYSIIGMDTCIANHFHIRQSDENGIDAVQYITETYLECIESVSFEEWIINGNHDGKVMILSESDFKYKYSEIFNINHTLQGAIDDIVTLYGCEWWMFAKYEYEEVFLATTYYKDDYSKLKIRDVEKMMASFDTALTLNAVTEEIRQIFIKQINEATNNFFYGYKIEKMSNEELFDELDYKLGLGYQTGRNEDWLLYKEVV